MAEKPKNKRRAVDDPIGSLRVESFIGAGSGCRAFCLGNIFLTNCLKSKVLRRK